MTPRATTSASNIARRALCPGSERMEEGLPEENSEQSEEGRMLHDFAADPTKDRSQLKRAHRDLLETNGRLVRAIFERVANQFGDDIALAHGKENITWYLHRGIKSLYPGHPDLWEYRPRKLLVVIDYKFGFKVVTPAAANLQLRSYGVMGAENHDADHVVVAITQPRLPRDEQLTIAVYSRDDIANSANQLYGIWDACKEPDAPLVAGEEQCRYCKAKLLCSAYQATMTGGLSLVPVPPPATLRQREATVEKSLASLPDQQIERMIEAVKFADFVSGPLMDEARRRIREGQMPGWKLGKESEVTEIVDVPAALAVLERAGFPLEKLGSALKMKKGEIEDIYRDAHENMTWADAKHAVADMLAPFIEKHTKARAVQKDPAAQKKIAA